MTDLSRGVKKEKVKKREVKLLYKISKFAEILQDLRKPNGKTNYTLEELSDAIKEKTGVYISATQLSKYENTDSNEIINVNNLLALSEFWNVSINYLLGKNECTNIDNEEIRKRIGLSDRAINNIKTFSLDEAKELSNFLSNYKSRQLFNRIANYREKYHIRRIIRWRREERMKQIFKGEPFEFVEEEADEVDFAQYKCSQGFISILEEIAERSNLHGEYNPSEE